MDTTLSHDWAAWVIGLAALGAVASMALGAWRAFRDAVRARIERRAAAAAPALAADRDAPPAGVAVAPAPRPAGGTCRHCDRAAGYRAPRIVVGRPWYDGLLRRAGVVGALRLELVTQDFESPVELCGVHWERARALCAVEVGEVAVDYARWLDAWVGRVHAFQRDGLGAKLAAAPERAPAPPARAANGAGRRGHTWGAGA